jgi:threonine dehydrogenase-like Zn-dependent dehydrogenase
MKALFYPAWDQLEIRDVLEPLAKPGEVVLRVLAAGICGSELHGFVTHAARRTPPLIMGHEFCGEILTLGEGVEGYRVGDQVVVNSAVACGACEYCQDAQVNLCRNGGVFGAKRPGGFAERVAVPVSTLMPMPEGITPLQASLAEPLANGVHALGLTRQRFPERFVIFGAGTIGLFVLQVARASGALRILVVDVSDARLAVADRLGASAVVNAKKADPLTFIRDSLRGRGADVVVDAVGAAETRRAAITATRPGGEIVWLGLHDDPTDLSGFDVVLREKYIYGSFAVTARDLRTALALFAAGKVTLEPWVRTFPLTEGVRVFRQLVTSPPDDYIKAVLLPT